MSCRGKLKRMSALIKQPKGWAMASIGKNCWAGYLALLLMASSAAMGAPVPAACWTAGESAQLIDLEGSGKVQGAWVLSQGQLMERLRQTQVSTGILLHGYDLLSASRVCADIAQANLRQAKLSFGGREWYMAEQGAPAWDWLLVSIDELAANILTGDLPGIFIGEGKAVVGKGLTKSKLTDPGQVAEWLMDTHQARFEPVILFVSVEHQQRFFEFFSANRLPGVFLSFDDAEVVKGVLNKYASISADDQARLLPYY